ncbi:MULTISPECIES: DUF1176 domain-containing protein [Aminobacter]|jgi:hypothetical protein|uniref:DUF1176 domain-containing protein n=1 Tax=Aminobacter ciceronei TaxID=150723 RepID=A0ABR6C5A9_9HYPH|nr:MULTISPECIES: DUF1176 domain-containing protein [Aminobacter]MBA8906147.1 hypothetical protein [Aminobacter ciceronei]MBA9019926.1 hypothetical protein [Aminobacter ciceronei]MRX31676.1 DUF1176 domain-containing protein [Aminobacter sp. MDW-2]QNH32165.1 DUF1176 domain-containing protein [Aminobacter sp. MDW-2]
MRTFSTRAALTAALTSLWSFQALAADLPYLDDRSDAAAVVRSLYNAVSRKEYARAWDYFGDAKPAKDFAEFAKGYEKTERVEIETGAVSSDGAAGSIFYNIPVAIRAIDKDGTEKVFAGCYTARQVNGSIQEPPFTPIQLEKGALKPAEGNLSEALPKQCGDAPPTEIDAVLDLATKTFAASHKAQCDVAREGDEAIQSYKISYHNKSDAADAPASEARLFRFFCQMGAYNETHVYYLWNEADGLNEQHFAAPELDIHYEGDNPDGKLESVNVIGYRTENALVNSSFDDKTMTITSHAKWRGVGDASSDGTWLFRDGAFALVRYDVDASYDGDINPETVLDYNSGP